MHKIADKLTQVKHRIQQAARLSGRYPNEITLLAVSKKHSEEAIREAYLAGQQHFGENYLQEALTKIKKVQEEGICWHFIGPIQGNKAKKIAEKFDWVHSVDRLKVAQKLSKHRPETKGALNVCLQINIDSEDTKSGILPDNALELARAVAKLPNINLRGLMAIPEKDIAPGTEDNAFSRLRQLFEELKLHNKRLASMDTLSMGMSADLETAVWEGSTIVRIGTDIFGPRPTEDDLHTGADVPQRSESEAG